MADRQRIRVGREATYFPTDAEAAAVSDPDGVQWPCTLAKVNPDGTVNLEALRGNGTPLAVTDVARGQRKGEFELRGLAQSV